MRKIENFTVCGKIFEVGYAFKGHCKTRQRKKYRNIAEILDCAKFTQGSEEVLLIDPNGIHKNILLELVLSKYLLSKIFYFSKDLIKSMPVCGYFKIA